MGSLTQDMERLANEVRRGREARRRQASELREGEAQRRQKAAFEADLRAQKVAQLRADVRGELAAGRRALSEQSAALRANLQAFNSDLKAEVATFRADLQRDLAGARAAWSDVQAAAAGTVRAHRPVAAAPPAAKPPEPARAPDDFTTISGIGPGIQERLHKAGVTTFAALASAPVEHLRDILGELNRLAHVEDWGQAARERLGGQS
ncbi:MAG: helix-hairpin-helix domain-containing protein [Acidobacteriota bacterium]